MPSVDLTRCVRRARDVQCTFGILKGRFRILKLPFEFHDAVHIDNVFFTCCALHNIIQMHRGYDRVWQEDRDWAGRDGLFGNDMVGDFNARRVQPTSDFSYAGGTVRLDGDDIEQSEGWTEFGEALATHYNYAKAWGLVQWPKSQRLCAGRVH